MTQPAPAAPASPRAHLPWVDLIRVVAVFQVILVHLSYPIFFKGDLPRSYWLAANFYDSLSRMGVPLFFMVSGALLLQRPEPIGVFLRKRFLKVGIPTLFWSVFYLWLSTDAYRDDSMQPLHIVLSMLKAVYLGDVEIHLWFLYYLIAIYLAVPVLWGFVSTAGRSGLAYFLALWFLSTPVLELAARITGFQPAFQIPVMSGYIGYFVLGYFLKDTLMTASRKALALAGVVSAVVATYVGTIALSAQAETIDAFLYSYFSLPTVLAAACGFLLLKEWGSASGTVMKLVQALSAHSFGVFLVHILVIDLLRKGTLGIRLYSWSADPATMIPLTAIAAFLLSVLIVFLIRRIPVLKSLIP